MCHLGQITVTPNSHMLEPLSYPYGLPSGFLICPLDRITESIYCIIHAHISWTASLAWMHPVIVLQLLLFSIFNYCYFLFRYAAMCDCVLVYTFAMSVCSYWLCVAHTCFSLSVIVVLFFGTRLIEHISHIFWVLL